MHSQGSIPPLALSLSVPLPPLSLRGSRDNQFISALAGSTRRDLPLWSSIKSSAHWRETAHGTWGTHVGRGEVESRSSRAPPRLGACAAQHGGASDTPAGAPVRWSGTTALLRGRGQLMGLGKGELGWVANGSRMKTSATRPSPKPVPSLWEPAQPAQPDTAVTRPTKLARIPPTTVTRPPIHRLR